MVKYKVAICALIRELLEHWLNAWLPYHFTNIAWYIVFCIVDAEFHRIAIAEERDRVRNECGHIAAESISIIMYALPDWSRYDTQKRLLAFFAPAISQR